MRMSARFGSIWLKAIGAASLAAFVAGATASADTTRIVTIKIDGDGSDVRELRRQGYDVTHVDKEKGIADIVLRSARENMLISSGDFDVVESKTIDTKAAPDSGYKTPQEVDDLVHQYASEYPALTHLESIGQSLQDREIWALKITDNPEQREKDEPRILFNAMHHAREVMTTEVAVDTIDFLLENYGTDDQVTRWVDNNEIWVVPMVNPDGNNKVWTEDSMWRKNARGGYGVDLNRNYPFGWNSCDGSSGWKYSQTYRGPEPASEPETQALMGLVERIQPVYDISYHSYSELIIYPYGCPDMDAARNVVQTTASQLSQLLPKDHSSGGYDAGTPYDLLYAVDGGDIDWMYHEYHVIPYVIELNSRSEGFQPSYDQWREPTVEKLRDAWGHLIDELNGSAIRGVVVSDQGRALPEAEVTAQSLAKDKNQQLTWQVKPDGTFHMVLEPGMYKVVVSHDGETAEREVTVGQERVDLQFEL